MNLARVLDVSLPELPRQQFKETYFCFNPETVFRVEPKGDTIIALAPKSRKVFVFTPEQWQLVQLFNGRLPYNQIGVLWKNKSGIAASPKAIQSFAESLDVNGFWLKTAQEESAALALDLAENRRAKVKKQENSFGKVYVWHFDPNEVLTRAHRKIRWMWSPPFVMASLVALLVMFGLWVARWDEVWRDSLLYWNMTEKTLADIGEFYLIFLVVGFFHESGHAFTAKNFGAEVHKVGLLLVYTTPAFFVGSSEVWVYGTRMQRIYTILAGFWVELMLCAVATFVWWATPVTTPTHDLAYKFILVGGLMPVIFNMNPLMRLDGYLCFCEIVRVQNLKEKATLFLSNWVQKHVFRMPVNVPVLPRRRAIFFASYAFLSGVYTYFILLFLARVTYKVLYHFTPEWAFLPATLVALRVFKSRIEKLLKFLKSLYLSKRELMRTHSKKLIAAGAVALVLLFVPFWREDVSAPFVLEPVERAVLRAQVPGRVENVMVQEGQIVPPGAPVARLRDLNTESDVARASSEFNSAKARAMEAQLRYVDVGKADSERQQWARQLQLATDRNRSLNVVSPIGGTVVTARVQDLEGRWVTEGTTIAEIQDLSALRARIFVTGPEMRMLSEITGHSLLLESSIWPLSGTFVSISPTPQTVDPGLISESKYKGLQLTPHYVVTIQLNNPDGKLRAGMSGKAKIFGGRQSVAGMVGRPVADFLGRKIW